jgi:hypothetical protein
MPVEAELSFGALSRLAAVGAAAYEGRGAAGDPNFGAALAAYILMQSILSVVPACVNSRTD